MIGIAKGPLLTKWCKMRRVTSFFYIIKKEEFTLSTLKRVTLGDALYDVKRPWPNQEKSRIFSEISHLSLAPTGEVYILQRQEPIIIVFSYEGERIKKWKHPLLDGGHALHIAENGRVFLADWDDHILLIFDSNGELLQVIGDSMRPRFGQPFNHPTDVAVAPNGDLFITDGYGNSCVHHFDAQGNHIKTWGEPGEGPGQFSTPHALCFDKEGRILVTDRENNRVQIFNQEGHYIGQIGHLYHPMDIAVDTEGFIYVTDQTPRLSKFSPEGKLIGRCRTMGTYAHGLDVDPEGNIYLAEMLPSNVTKLIKVEE